MRLGQKFFLELDRKLFERKNYNWPYFRNEADYWFMKYIAPIL